MQALAEQRQDDTITFFARAQKNAQDVWGDSKRVHGATLIARAHEETEIREGVRRRFDKIARTYRDQWPHDDFESPAVEMFTSSLDDFALRRRLHLLALCLEIENRFNAKHHYARLKIAAEIAAAMQWAMALVMVQKGVL